MNICEPFIRRPIATTLLTAAIALAGAVAFHVLPVSPLPQVDFPTIYVNASLPGASPETMASSVATPLERQFGRIASVTEMTSSSSLGSTSITLQFDLNRNIDAAARDVQAAINAARGYLPTNLPSNPTYRKVNPADSPIFMIALTSDVLDKGQMYDAASTIMAQKLSQITGVGQVTVGGSALPGVRIELNPDQAEQVRHRPGTGAHATGQRQRQYAQGTFFRWRADVGSGRQRSDLQGHRLRAADRRLSATARRCASPMSARPSIPWKTCATPATPTASPPCWSSSSASRGANIIDTVDRIRAALPQLKASIPAVDRYEGGHGSDGHHPRLGARYREDAGDLGGAGDPGGVPFPAESAHHVHPQRGRAGLADRHVRRDVPAGLQPRQSFADGADHLHRASWWTTPSW